ncbi:MAG TPA: hypothetical protein VIM71_03540 [Lacunisphaera sp.]
MKQLLTPLLLIGLVLCGLTGCSSNTEIMAAGLRVEVTQVQRDQTGAVQVSWRIRNPNVVSYLFSKSSHKLSLNGTAIGTLTDTSPLGVPQGSQADRTSPLVPANATANEIIDRAISQGSASYRLDSIMWVLIVDDDTEKIPLNSSGSVPVTAK